MKPIEFLKKLYFWSCGYSYTNLGRLFLRLFVGLMLLQFGVRQWINFDEASLLFPSIIGMSSEQVCILMIGIEIFCSLFIMIGFFTRLMIIPPFIALFIAEYLILAEGNTVPYMLTWSNPGFLPVMFMGIYFFLLLVGPGKISVDYFFSLYIIHNDNKSETELEEV